MCVCVRLVVLAKQGFEVELKAADGRVERVELPAFLSCPTRSARVLRLLLHLKVSMEFIAALQVAKATGQRGMKGRSDGSHAVVREKAGLGF